jgi:hypothetical protein
MSPCGGVTLALRKVKAAGWAVLAFCTIFTVIFWCVQFAFFIANIRFFVYHRSIESVCAPTLSQKSAVTWCKTF